MPVDGVPPRGENWEPSFIPFTESKGFITEKAAKKSLKFVCSSQSENSFDFC